MDQETSSGGGSRMYRTRPSGSRGLGNNTCFGLLSPGTSAKNGGCRSCATCGAPTPAVAGGRSTKRAPMGTEAGMQQNGGPVVSGWKCKRLLLELKAASPNGPRRTKAAGLPEPQEFRRAELRERFAARTLWAAAPARHAGSRCGAQLWACHV